MNERWIEAATLAGSQVILEPLSISHLEGIKQAVQDGEPWNFVPIGTTGNPAPR
jgi:hypothetical protein